MSENLLEALVGEDKKFKTTEDLAKGKLASDDYISTLEGRMDQMRTEMETLRTENMAKAKLEDLLDQWQNRQQQLPDTTTQVAEKTPSKEEFMSLIDSRVEERETRKRQTENYNLVKQRLISEYGENYASVLSSHIQELGISESFLNDTAKNNPKALLRMLGFEGNTPTKDPFRAPPTSQVRPGFQGVKEKRSWSWYQKLKQENPKEYYSPKTNVMMHKDALELGDDFEDGDFGRYGKDFRIKY